MIRRATVLRLLFACLCLMVPAAAPAEDHSAGPDADAAHAALSRLRRGVNVLGYDGVWSGENDAPFRMTDFKLVREAGFDHVRINLFALRYIDAQGRLDDKVLARLDRVIAAATLADLNVVLDQHDNRLCQAFPRSCEGRLVNFWRQAAAHYAGKEPRRLVYEILNEPGGSMTAAEWNVAQNAALRTIRALDPDRTVIVSALNADDPHDIERLDLPAGDRNLIVTIHYYRPMTFTHQGAPWARAYAGLHDVAWGSDADKAAVDADLALAAAWARLQKRPVYLGEFGVYDAAPPASRLSWTRHVARTAEQYGWGWAYWQFDHDFALFDTARHEWNRPLLKALAP